MQHAATIFITTYSLSVRQLAGGKRAAVLLSVICPSFASSVMTETDGLMYRHLPSLPSQKVTDNRQLIANPNVAVGSVSLKRCCSDNVVIQTSLLLRCSVKAAKKCVEGFLLRQIPGPGKQEPPPRLSLKAESNRNSALLYI